MDELQQVRLQIVNALICQGITDSATLEHEADKIVSFIFKPLAGKSAPQPPDSSQHKE